MPPLLQPISTNVKQAASLDLVPRGTDTTLREMLEECNLLGIQRAEKIVRLANLLKANGFSHRQAAAILRVPTTTLLYWSQRYARGGIAAISPGTTPKAKRVRRLSGKPAL
jgi:hypothetical protein